ncbi:MAG: 3-isopropylmalate dehydratase small subunit [Candidatus Bathyarchaeia archaeon]
MSALRGRIIKYPDNVNTDDIIPARYLSSMDMDMVAGHAFEDYDPGFMEKIRERDIIVAGKNFGCGSSREHAVIVLKKVGIKAIIAESFARIFFWNSINQGLLVLQLDGSSEPFEDGDGVRIDLGRAVVENETKSTIHRLKPFPQFLMPILNEGGLVPYLKKRRSWEFR